MCTMAQITGDRKIYDETLNLFRDRNMYDEVKELISGWDANSANECYAITKLCDEGFNEYEIEIPCDELILKKTLEIFKKYHPQDAEKYRYEHHSKFDIL